MRYSYLAAPVDSTQMNTRFVAVAAVEVLAVVGGAQPPFPREPPSLPHQLAAGQRNQQRQQQQLQPSICILFSFVVFVLYLPNKNVKQIQIFIVEHTLQDLHYIN